MENIEIYKNSNNEDYVAITNLDGSVTSMPKAVYDEQQAALKDK